MRGAKHGAEAAGRALRGPAVGERCDAGEAAGRPAVDAAQARMLA